MQKLTNLFGSHLEYIGLDMDERITQNPAYLRSVNACKDVICIGDIKIPDYYDEERNFSKERMIGIKNHTILMVNSASILFIQEKTIKSFGMVEFRMDAQGHLHMKQTTLENGYVKVGNKIFDANGVELQRDIFVARSNSIIRRLLANETLSENVKNLMIRAELFDFMSLTFALGKAPEYKKTKGSHYKQYRRDMENIDIVHISNDSGVNLTESLDLGYGLTTMLFTGQKPRLVSKEELAEAIALESSEETRRALISYCSGRGVTKENVLQKLP